MFNITGIELTNIRGFKSLKLNFESKTLPRKKTLIIGKNSTCKTTLLRCIAIGLSDLSDANALIAEPIGNLITDGHESATIKINLIHNDTHKEATKKIVKKDEKEVIDYDTSTSLAAENLFLCGYGISRANANQTPTFRTYRIVDSVYTLFRYDEPLVDTELTIRRLKDFLGKNIYLKTMRGIKKALGLSQSDKINLPRGGGVTVSGPTIGKDVPLEGLADGYRITFSWIIDLYSWAMRADIITKEGGIKGIFLIDELEQHFHPSLQTEALLRLNKLFPELQIIATTHSPLVALGAKPDELVVLKKNRKYIIAEENVPNFMGYSAEDMIVDKHIFNSIIYSPFKNKKLSNYNKLASKSKLTANEKIKLKKLANELSSIPPPIEQSPLSIELEKLRIKYGL
jgi:predicted ATP-binding protein involved in virulence